MKQKSKEFNEMLNLVWKRRHTKTKGEFEASGEVKPSALNIVNIKGKNLNPSTDKNSKPNWHSGGVGTFTSIAFSVFWITYFFFGYIRNSQLCKCKRVQHLSFDKEKDNIWNQNTYLTICNNEMKWNETRPKSSGSMPFSTFAHAIEIDAI